MGGAISRALSANQATVGPFGGTILALFNITLLLADESGGRNSDHLSQFSCPEHGHAAAALVGTRDNIQRASHAFRTFPPDLELRIQAPGNQPDGTVKSGRRLCVESI
jgi:hypothetical protein